MLLSDESQILVLGIFLINKSRTQKYNRLRNKNVLILQMIDYICQGKKTNDSLLVRFSTESKLL
jgi:hypothetical protein